VPPWRASVITIKRVFACWLAAMRISDLDIDAGMISKRLLFSRLSPFPLAWLAMGLAGCSERLGPPERMPVTQVTGLVTEGSRRVSGGWIEFFPVDGTVGNLRSARIRPDGSFQADRVPVGLNLIRLVNVPLGSPQARKIFGAYTSPIRRTVPAHPTEPIVVDVVEESIRLSGSFARRGSAESRAPGESQ
jgi:hypothetical protein